MRIDPVIVFLPASDPPAAQPRVRPETLVQSTASNSSTPASDPPPPPKVDSVQIQESQRTKSAAPVPMFPQDEVKVQYDKQLKEELIYQFLDTQSGAEFMQVPSQQVLNVAHRIFQELSTEAARQAAAPQNAGGKNHG